MTEPDFPEDNYERIEANFRNFFASHEELIAAQKEDIEQRKGVLLNLMKPQVCMYSTTSGSVRKQLNPAKLFPPFIFRLCKQHNSVQTRLFG